MVTSYPSMLWCAAIFYVVLSQISAEKSWRDYNLFVGPKSSETGRYVYENSLGSKEHCHYCERRALLDSTYSRLQQPLCIRNYDGKKIEEAVLPQERNETKYPLCNTGELPGCGKPPDEKKSKSHKWVCDPGYSNIFYSVYFSCGLICNVTDKVQWSYYCNESLQWEVERQIPWESCEVPFVVEEKASVSLKRVLASAAGAIILVVVVIVLICFCKRRKKARLDLNGVPANQNNIEPANNRNPPQRHEQAPLAIVRGENPVNDEVVVDESVGSQGSKSNSYGPSSDEEKKPLMHPRKRDAGIGTDNSISQDEGHRVDDQSDLEGAVGGEETKDEAESRSQNDPEANGERNPASKEKPDIRVMLMRDGKSEKSIPLQNGFYSIEKGVDYAVVPSSPGGVVVKDFKIVRKKEGKPFRGNPLNFWFIIYSASEEDAGLFMWQMRLENNEIFEGSFEIAISLPDLLPMREEPVGEENVDEPIQSVRNRVNMPYLSQPYQMDSVSHLNLSSVLKNPNSNSLKNNYNVQVVPVAQISQIPHTHMVNVEVHPELTPVASMYRHTPDLSSSMFRNDQNGPNFDSGLLTGEQELNGPNSSRLGNMSPSQSYHDDEHDFGNRIRSGNLTGTSGYESQSSAVIARERFNANLNGAPDLDIDSLSSRAVSARTHSGLREPDYYDNDPLLSRGQGRMLSTRPDPAGDSSPNQFTEVQRGYDPHDPEQSHRKEVVESRMQQPLRENVNGYENRNNGGISSRLDYAEIPKCCGQHEDIGSDSDSLSERLTSVPILSPDFAILPQNYGSDNLEDIAVVNGEIDPRREKESLDDDIVEDSFVVNDDIVPRREIQISGESYEINVVTNGTKDDESIKQDETKL